MDLFSMRSANYPSEKMRSNGEVEESQENLEILIISMWGVIIDLVTEENHMEKFHPMIGL